jgi:hypothetical protein
VSSFFVSFKRHKNKKEVIKINPIKPKEIVTPNISLVEDFGFDLEVHVDRFNSSIPPQRFLFPETETALAF